MKDRLHWLRRLSAAGRKPLSLRLQTYMVLTVLMLVLLCWYLRVEQEQARELLQASKKAVLLEMVTGLEQRMPFNFHTLLEQKGLLTASADEQRWALHQALQPVVEQVYSRFSGSYSLGYYDRNLHIVAYMPLREPSLLSHQATPETMRIYETKQTEIRFIDRGLTQGNASIFAVNYPLFDNNVMIGHVYATIKTDEIEQEIQRRVHVNVMNFGLLWVAIIGCVGLSFERINRLIARLNHNLQAGNFNPEPFKKYPELASIAAIVEQLQEQMLRHEAAYLTEQIESLTHFEQLFHSSHTAQWLMRTDDLRYVDVNAAWEQLTGSSKTDALGRTDVELGILRENDPQIEMYRPQLLAGEPIQQEIEIRRKDGETRRVLMTANTVTINQNKYYLFSSQDITDQKRMETELAHLDRLNLVGEMAAGIGHEVRNPLTTVRGYLQVLQMKPELARYHEQFTTMIGEIDQANGIITTFLSLAKNKAVHLKRDNLTEHIRSLVPLLEADAFRQEHKVFAMLDPVPDSEFDRSEISQLVINLVRNSLEAMTEPGTVVVRTYAKPEAIVLEVADTGQGIPDVVMKKLGTPFVTTKDGGTGLGLAICYRIASRHGARIDVASGPRGAQFSIKFPLG